MIEGMSRWKLSVQIGVMCGVLATVSALVAVGKEARPPKWSRDVLDAFFDDAREKLEGSRPDYGAAAQHERTAEVNPAAEGGEMAWSKLISADALETEVKRLSQSVAGAVASPSAFKGGGNKVARRDFSELAVLFAVTAQYDGEARWKDAAAGLRDVFSQAAAHAKVGSDASYGEAVARKQDLADLVRGGRPQLPQAEANVADWSRVAGRAPLMQRLNVAHQERLTKWLADAATFRRNQSDVAHEAQVVALLADVIHRESFEYWDDETFVEYAGELRDAATDVSAAADAGNLEQAQTAIGRATKACADCHDGYRG
jgi:Cytochrome C'